MVRQKGAVELGRQEFAFQLYHLINMDQCWTNY